MADRVQIAPRDRRILEALVRKHLPDVEVWAYGSRVNGRGHDRSDLDLVLRAPDLKKLPAGQLLDFAAAIRESTVPFLVEAQDWACLPQRFHREIERAYVVMSRGAPPQAERRGPVTSESRSEWPIVKLEEVSSDQPGSIAIGPFGSRMKSDVYTPSGVPVIRGTNISTSRAWRNEWVYVSDDFADRLPNCNVREGDLVFPHRGSIGEVAIIPGDKARYMLSTSLMKFRPDPEKVSPLFLFYYFRSDTGRAEIMRYSSQVGTPGIGQPLSSLRQFRVPIPPRANQEHIAGMLSVLDEKIEMNRRMSTTVEAMAWALFRSWFVDFDPVRAKMEGHDTALPKDIADLFPERLVDSELGKIPAGWRVAHVEDGFNIVMGQSPPGHTYNDAGDGLPFFQGCSDFGFRYPTNRKFCTAPNRIAQPWDTIVSVRAPVGRINMAWERCCIGRGVAALWPKHGTVSYGYCAAQALQTHMREYEHAGTVFGAINRKQLARLPLMQPTPDVVRAFEDLVHPWDQMIRLRTAELAAVTALRDTLLPRLMSGALRL